ncbi:MAG: FAD-dependent oxidoreductase, partial [Nitrososphaeraceae archaeon]
MARAKQALILGGGFGGLTAANLIRKSLSQEECEITVVDKNQHFMMGLVNLWILSGSRRLEDSQVALDKLESKEIKFLNDEITNIDLNENSVTTKTNHDKLKYDYLIIALGAELAPERISGLEDNVESCFNVYDAKQVPRLRKKILSLKSGRVVVCIADIPYKCPPAPYEVSLLINDILVKNATRDSIDLNMY